MTRKCDVVRLTRAVAVAIGGQDASDAAKLAAFMRVFHPEHTIEPKKSKRNHTRRSAP